MTFWLPATFGRGRRRGGGGLLFCRTAADTEPHSCAQTFLSISHSALPSSKNETLTDVRRVHTLPDSLGRKLALNCTRICADSKDGERQVIIRLSHRCKPLCLLWDCRSVIIPPVKKKTCLRKKEKLSPNLEENYWHTRDVIINPCIATADRCWWRWQR